MCPECAEGVGIQNVELLTVFGFNAGALTVQQTFEISFGYRTYTLTGPGWSAVDRVVIQPLDGDGLPGTANVNACCTVVLDDIVVDGGPPTPRISEGGVVLATRRRHGYERLYCWRVGGGVGGCHRDSGGVALCGS